MAKANKARGDHSVTIDGETFVLRGTFANLAALQTALGVDGLPVTLRLVSEMDPRAVYEGVRCLAVEGDTAKLADAPFNEFMLPAQEAILGAIMGSLPEAEPGNAPSGKAPSR